MFHSSLCARKRICETWRSGVEWCDSALCALKRSSVTQHCLRGRVAVRLGVLCAEYGSRTTTQRCLRRIVAGVLCTEKLSEALQVAKWRFGVVCNSSFCAG